VVQVDAVAVAEVAVEDVVAAGGVEDAEDGVITTIVSIVVPLLLCNRIGLRWKNWIWQN
jgi:hypothetical protein